MATLIASGTGTSVAAGAKSANLVSGTFENLPKAKVTLACRGSATGLFVTLMVGGIPIINDQPVLMFGATGNLDISAHINASAVAGPGRAELYFRNSTVGALTIDYALFAEGVR
jgi:hypothetical protein